MIKHNATLFAIIIAIFVSYLGVDTIILGVVTLMNRNFGTIYGGESVYVKTSYGKLRGFTSISRDGNVFHEFLGIPFAEKPIGELRFKPPIPHRKWIGVRDAMGYGHQCWQYDFILQHLMGNEDCLTLNVHVPKLKSKSNSQLLPVMVYLYGGAYMFGKSEVYRPEFFMDENVVLVTLNYRLGAFGFLNTGDEVVRGNMGLKDQVMALKYIKENIANFGGDPNSVTLLGESAGAASINLHMLSEASKGLFHRAISMSGTSLAQWSFNIRPKEQSIMFADNFNCSMGSSIQLVSCLRSLNAREIAKEFEVNLDLLHDRLTVFTPSIEAVNDSDTFLSEHPRDLLKRGAIINRVPWITGVNSEEGLIYAVPILQNKTCTKKLNDEWEIHAPKLLDYEHLPKYQRDEISSKIRYYYLQDRNISLETMHDIVKLFSDLSFNRPIHYAAKYHLSSQDANNNPPIHLYYYSHKGRFGIAQVYMAMNEWLPVAFAGLIVNAKRWVKTNIFGIEEEHHYGTCHADEIGVLFTLPAVVTSVAPHTKEYGFSKLLVNVWTSFAKTGKPPTVNGLVWNPINRNKPLEYMELSGEKTGMISEPFANRLKFWSDLLDKDIM